MIAHGAILIACYATKDPYSASSKPSQRPPRCQKRFGKAAGQKKSYMSRLFALQAGHVSAHTKTVKIKQRLSYTTIVEFTKSLHFVGSGPWTTVPKILKPEIA